MLEQQMNVNLSSDKTNLDMFGLVQGNHLAKITIDMVFLKQ